MPARVYTQQAAPPPPPSVPPTGPDLRWAIAAAPWILARANFHLKTTFGASRDMRGAKHLAVGIAISGLAGQPAPHLLISQFVTRYGHLLKVPGISGESELEAALQTLDGEADQMASDPRQRGRPSKTQIKRGVQDAAKVRGRAERSQAKSRKNAPRAFQEVRQIIAPRIQNRLPTSIPAELRTILEQAAVTELGSAVIANIGAGQNPIEALANAGVDSIVKRIVGNIDPSQPAHIVVPLREVLKAVIGSHDVAQKIAAGVAIGLLFQESMQLHRARKQLGSGSSAKESEGETGWDVALRQMATPARPAAAAGGGPVGRAVSQRPIVAPGPAARAHAHPSLPASQARKHLAHSVAPAFAAAIDKAVDPALVVRFVRQQPGGDLPRVRHAFVATAARHFATEFVRTISAAPKGTSEHLALGAIIATALSQAGRQFPLVPAAATPAMSVMIHKQLGPRLPALAALAARIVRSVPTAAATSAPSREMAW